MANEIPGIDYPPLDSAMPAGPDIGGDSLKAVNASSVINSSQSTTNNFLSTAQNLIGGVNAQALGSGIADLFQATGDRLEAKNYEAAQHLSLVEKSIQKQATAIQQFQATRSIYSGIGGQKVAAAAAGLGSGGSNELLLRQSAAQGALAHQVIGQQGLLGELNFQTQADAYNNMAKAAKNAATGDTIGGIFNIVTSIGGDIAKAVGL